MVGAMQNAGSSGASQSPAGKAFLVCLLCLLGVLLVLFYRSLSPDKVLFSNDGPLGSLAADQVAKANPMTGFWVDLNWVGINSGTATPCPTTLLFGLLGSPSYSKFYEPFTLLLLGLSAWFCFRQWGFRQAVCVIGAIAAMLNMNTFSNVAWGLGTRAVSLAAVFLCLAALGKRTGRFYWARCALAGLALGMAVMEGADNGGIYSLYIAAFILFEALIEEGKTGTKALKGVGRVALVAGFAFFMAVQTIVALVGVSVKGVAGMAQTSEAKEMRWAEATQWSLPKGETLRVIIPGLFGYRMDEESPTPQGGMYWGGVGRTPGWEEHHMGIPRHSGSGEYAGVLVVLLAAWSAAQGLRRNGSVFTDRERKIVLFWAGAALVSLLLAWGRHAFFYRILYALPYFSTIRNPIKFMHPFHLSVLILFAYGLQGLSRRYLETAAAKTLSWSEQLKAWWAKASSFEKKWTFGSAAAVALSILGLLIYSSARNEVLKHLSSTGFSTEQAGAIARHSVGEVGLFIVLLIISAGLVTLIMAGVFSGRRARWALVSLGLLLVIDLARANTPWIKYINYKEKYASNPIIDLLRQNPHEHRVAMPPFGAGRQFEFFQSLYNIEWLQHLFLYYNIQSLDMAQDPRPPLDKIAFRKAIGTNYARLWQLTNTRYLGGMAGGFAESLNQILDPQKQRFKVHTPFTFTQSQNGGFAVQTNETGPFALLEFTGALPRAKLYAQWQVSTNDESTLQQLGSREFDPEQLVLVSGDVPAPPTSGPAPQNPGTVKFVSYAPKHLQLRSQAETPALLLLNDKFDPDWKVRVDGQPAKLLRANYLMRGVYLPKGEHTIEMRFSPSLRGLYVTLSAMGLGVILCGFLAVAERREKTIIVETQGKPETKPLTKPRV